MYTWRPSDGREWEIGVGNQWVSEVGCWWRYQTYTHCKPLATCCGSWQRASKTRRLEFQSHKPLLLASIISTDPGTSWHGNYFNNIGHSWLYKTSDLMFWSMYTWLTAQKSSTVQINLWAFSNLDWTKKLGSVWDTLKHHCKIMKHFRSGRLFPLGGK